LSDRRRSSLIYSKRSLHGQVAHDLGGRILRGDLAPGAVLPNEADFSASLRVSRTALREAIKILAAKGLVESRPKTGTRVRPRADWNLLDPDVLAWQWAAMPRAEFVREIFELRRAFEPSVAALAAKRATQEHIRVMAEALDEMDEAGDDGRRFIGPDTRFHRAILTAVGNGMLRSLSSVIETALTVSMYLSLDTPRGQHHSVPLHRAVYDAFRARDAAAAQQAMNELIDEAEDDAQKALRIKRPQARQKKRREAA